MTKPAKSPLHPRNPHHGRYDFTTLCRKKPELKAYVKTNPKGDDTIDFADSDAVLALNKALLAQFYQIQFWQIPAGYLCPPIPGRADYIHYLADLLAEQGIEPHSKAIKVLDIGCGANCIYPIVGNRSYGWRFVGSEIDPLSVKVAQTIVASNASIKNAITIRQQNDPKAIFDGAIKDDEPFDLTLCNPPFYESPEHAKAQNDRKRANLGLKQAQRNFQGTHSELWCEGGELRFISDMAHQSVRYKHQVKWFTSLVSNKQHIKPLKSLLKSLGAQQIKVVDMAQGQKISRFIAWRFSPQIV